MTCCRLPPRGSQKTLKRTQNFFWNMSNNAAHGAAGGTEALISNTLTRVRACKITRDARFLDDEKLPESERVHVLHQIFNRNIRLKQIERLAGTLSCVLEGASPHNLLVYGPSGAGKSVTCLHFLATLKRMAEAQGTPFHYFYLDLTTPKSCFGALNELAIALDGSVRRYRKGIALEQMQEAIVDSLRRLEGIVCILIDEVDNLTSGNDIFLAFLAKTLPKRVEARLSFLMLSNKIEWDRTIDPRILAVLKKQDVMFEPYDALDLLEILRLRVQKALDPSKVDEAALNKIAGLASRETGDARKAVELLAKAVKIAEDTSGRLTVAEVDLAEEALETDKTEELIGSLPVQQKLALKACYWGIGKAAGRLSTGAAYQSYQSLCSHEGCRPLTQRRFSDMISFLDIYGLINARVISKGRYGKTRELSGSLPDRVVQRLLGREKSALLAQYLE